MTSKDVPDLSDTIVKATLAAVPWVGGPLAVIADDVMRRQAAKAAETVQSIADQAGFARLLARLETDTQVEALFVDAVEAATRSGLQQKRGLLAKVVASAVQDDAQIEPAQLIVLALRDLDAPHIRALARIQAAEAGALVELDNGLDESQEAASDAVSAAVTRQGRLEPVPVVATLIRTGVVLPATLFGGGIAVYRISDFGRQLLADLGGGTTDPPA